MLSVFAWVSLGAAFLCALVILVHEVRRPQKMAIMNVVWPVTALYLSVFGLWAYVHFGPRMAKDAPEMKDERTKKHAMSGSGDKRGPTLAQAAIAATHCGSGCAIADVATEFTLFGVGATLLGSALYAGFLWDFATAWVLGIVFQYLTIVPMRKLSRGEGIMAAMKADTLSILSFQVGMYAWMALVWFWIFPATHLQANNPVYWLMMQIAMVLGFITSTPMNWWLIRVGWKEAMG